jgi:hypothetical protein
MNNSWHLQINGSILKTNGKPVTYKSKKEAGIAGLELQTRFPDKKIKLISTIIDSTENLVNSEDDFISIIKRAIPQTEIESKHLSIETELNIIKILRQGGLRLKDAISLSDKFKKSLGVESSPANVTKEDVSSVEKVQGSEVTLKNQDGTKTIANTSMISKDSSGKLVLNKPQVSTGNSTSSSSTTNSNTTNNTSTNNTSTNNKPTTPISTGTKIDIKTEDSNLNNILKLAGLQ